MLYYIIYTKIKDLKTSQYVSINSKRNQILLQFLKNCYFFHAVQTIKYRVNSRKKEENIKRASQSSDLIFLCWKLQLQVTRHLRRVVNCYICLKVCSTTAIPEHRLHRSSRRNNFITLQTLRAIVGRTEIVLAQMFCSHSVWKDCGIKSFLVLLNYV